MSEEDRIEKDMIEVKKALGYINDLSPKEQAKALSDKAMFYRENSNLPNELLDIISFTHLIRCIIYSSDNHDKLYWMNVLHELEKLVNDKEKYGHLFPEYFEDK